MAAGAGRGGGEAVAERIEEILDEEWADAIRAGWEEPRS
jgi:hypothetical protein